MTTLAGTETLFVLAKQANGQPAATTEQCTTQDIANLAGSVGLTQIELNGATSGTTIVIPTAVASGTLTLPAATDTLVGKATTDVLTNKTLDTAGAGNVLKINGTTVSAVTGTGSVVLATSPTLVTPVLGVATATSLNGNTVTAGTGTLTLQGSAVVTGPATSGTVALINPAPQAGGSTLPVTAAMSGKPILLDTAGGTTATLPAATGSGNKYKFIVSVSTTSAAHKILAASVSDFIIGNAYGYTGSTAKVFGSPAATNHSIQMPNAGSQPSGGIIGDVFDFVDAGTNLWHCIGFYQAGTTPTTPFSSATS